jgi:hypothetical protein
MSDIDAKALGDLLKGVHLNGLLRECVLVVKDGVGHVDAVDMSNTVFLSLSRKIKGMEDVELGIGNLTTICKVLEDVGEEGVTLKIKADKDKWLTITRKGHGRLKSLLLDVDQVPTAVSSKGAKEKLLKQKGVDIEIRDKGMEDFVYYMGLVKSKGVVFQTSKGSLYLASVNTDEEQFRIKLGSLDIELSVEVNADFLLQILQTCIAIEGKLPTLYLGSGAPVILKLDKNNIWALTPITE